eukprot:Seg944.3 transcript_id=Seg944.3/GoldUCD/mRNA.D3Y31 product="hypothetical protein" protein_id=Seg944.3/GoldUCD/D3Y31
MAENANRGHVSAIVQDLNSAFEKGLLSGKSKILQFISNVVKNFSRKSPRYDKFTKQIFSCLRIIGGPRAARFLAKNLDGPSDDTQRRTKRQHHFRYCPEKLSDRVFQHIAEIYTNIKDEKRIVGDVLVETAEDETVIIGKAEWNSRHDEGWGWCGKAGVNHECKEDFVLKVGDDDDAYERLLDAFKENAIASYARVILINPVHNDLPPLVALLQAVCNKFDHEMVQRQWSEIRALYDRHLLPVLGPLVGHSSDGDSRRRKLHTLNSTSTDRVRYEVDHDNFTMTGKLMQSQGKIFPTGLSDQDFVHNGKKLVNHLMHPSRRLTLGENICHVNHLQLLLDNDEISRFDHGLQQPDVDRRDRMNWESAQRHLFPKVRECLEKINSGSIQPQENVNGTLFYLEMTWRYVEIFYSLSATLEERISNASFVCNILRIWRSWVVRNKDLSLKESFISRETFQDVCLSCHHVVLFVKASRDFAPNHPFEFRRLAFRTRSTTHTLDGKKFFFVVRSGSPYPNGNSRLGSDVCEEFFSANGSFVVNNHNYTITDMFQNLSNMQSLQEIFVDSEGPDNQKRHRKGENIWRKGHKEPTTTPDLLQFPSDVAISDAWERGLVLSQNSLRNIGIAPENDDTKPTTPETNGSFYPIL